MATKFLSPEAQFHAGVNGRELEEARRRTGATAAATPAATGAPQAAPKPRAASRRFSTIQNQEDAPPCSTCGSIMIRSGACYKCSTAATRRAARRVTKA